MDETKQILRWSIPGWLFLLILVINYLIYKSIFFIGFKFFQLNFIDIFLPIENFLKTDSPISSIAAIIFGIPLGYIIYQAYNVFHYRQEGDLSAAFPKQFPELMKNFKDETDNFYNDLPPNYKKDFYKKDIRYAVTYFFINNSDNKYEKNIKKEQYFSDLCHSLGVSIFAIFLSCIIFSITAAIFFIYNFDSISIIIFIISLLISWSIAFVIYSVLRRCRYKVKLQQFFLFSKLVNEIKNKKSVNKNNA